MEVVRRQWRIRLSPRSVAWTQNLDLGPYDEAITLGDQAIEFHFDQWYRTPIVGRVLRQMQLLNPSRRSLRAE